MDYRFAEDILLIEEVLGLSRQDLADATGISRPTLNRWAEKLVNPEASGLERLYGYAYRRRLRLNRNKEQFLKEDTHPPRIPLHHGAKTFLDGPVDHRKSREHNDFGKGFYCGETFEQAAMFVAGFAGSCVYALTFDPSGLVGRRYAVDMDWMLSVALCRGRLEAYKGSPRMQRLGSQLEAADYVVAPIADNRMFELIDEFADGEITDVQCEHALSATDLGMQWVLRTEGATSRVEVAERCYLCEAERAAYRAEGIARSEDGRNKAKMARRQYRRKGLYIEELFDEKR